MKNAENACCRMDIPIKMDSTLYEDVPKEEWVPMFQRICEEPWDEYCVNFLRDLLGLLNCDLSPRDIEATVFFLL
jgi:hypothetical protein